MAQVAAAVRAYDFRPAHAERAVDPTLHGARDAVEVRGPAAARRELVFCRVQRRGAPGAGVGAGSRGVLVILAGVRRLGALLAEDAELFCEGLG